MGGSAHSLRRYQANWIPCWRHACPSEGESCRGLRACATLAGLAVHRHHMRRVVRQPGARILDSIQDQVLWWRLHVCAQPEEYSKSFAVDRGGREGLARLLRYPTCPSAMGRRSTPTPLEEKASPGL